MRILFFSYNHPLVTPGGAQLVAHEMFAAARAAGHDCVFLAALEAEHESAYGKPGAPIVPAPGLSGEYFYFPQRYAFPNLSTGDWRSLHFLREFIERFRPDVVHFHHYHRLGVEALRCARIAAPQAVIGLTMHEMMLMCMADGQMVKRGPGRELCHAATPIDCAKCFPESRPEFFVLRARYLKAALEDCDLFVFPSSFLARRYVDWGVPAEKCAIVPNGQFHPAPDFDRSQHSPQVNRFGFFGQFIDNKGVDVILEALILLARERRVPSCGLVVEINGGNRHYASGPYIEKINRLVGELERLAVGPIRVQENGLYGRGDLRTRMQAVDWVITPSTWWEVFGLVVSEAWMFGRPVIAAAIGGLAERVVNGVNGFTFPPRDARALAELIVGLAGQRGKWLQVAGALQPPWSEKQMLDAHVGLWSEVAARRKNPSAINHEGRQRVRTRGP